jgi:hypothetical protein
MAPTQNDIDTGAQALKDYVTSIDGWEASFVPWGTYEEGAQLVLQTWDSATPAQTSDAATTGNAMRMAACGMALYQKISDAGYADRVTAQQCAAGASAILTATRLKGTADA